MPVGRPPKGLVPDHIEQPIQREVPSTPEVVVPAVPKRVKGRTITVLGNELELMESNSFGEITQDVYVCDVRSTGILIQTIVSDTEGKIIGANFTIAKDMGIREDRITGKRYLTRSIT